MRHNPLRCSDNAGCGSFKRDKEADNHSVGSGYHFDYKLALAAIDAGADKIRINPGNIGSPERVKKVVDSAKEHQIPIRVGVNSGSLEKDLLKKYGRVCPEALAESALNSVRLLEDMDFDDIVVSIKASDVMMCVEANKAFAKLSDRPLHVGITESGTLTTGNIKSAVGLALILNAGIGDTVRVSLTGDPVNEVYSALEILKALKMRTGNIDIVSCPTCGRTKIDLISLAEKNNIKYQLEVMVDGGTDAGVIHFSRGGVKTGGISIPTRYIHSPSEMIYKKDLDDTVKRLCAFLEYKFKN